eukprot:4024712-Karenia_brevis.AAC.1
MECMLVTFLEYTLFLRCLTTKKSGLFQIAYQAVVAGIRYHALDAYVLKFLTWTTGYGLPW